MLQNICYQIRDLGYNKYKAHTMQIQKHYQGISFSFQKAPSTFKFYQFQINSISLKIVKLEKIRVRSSVLVQWIRKSGP